MTRRSFTKLYEEMARRVETEGRKNGPQWFLGYMEGRGNKTLTGYQVGALVHLLLYPDETEKEENVENAVVDSGENKISIPGIL